MREGTVESVTAAGKVKRESCLGDVCSLVHASRSPTGEVRIAEDEVAHMRQLVATFCRMLGEQVLDGKPPSHGNGEPLSPRERQTLELLLRGNAEKEIAGRLAISRHTVHVYVKSLYKRYGVCSRGELLARWVKQ
jgi:DNA-binding CsgD family transcriptional regulator